MTQQPKNSPIRQDATNSNIARIEPSIPPHLTQSWVVWEAAAVIQTNGIKLDTGGLHDLLKKELESQKVPIDIFYTPNACWIIEGAKGERKIDKDRRARVVATLRNSIYTNMQFVAGIDYFGNSDWATIQMMMIVQPEKPEAPEPKPTKQLLINAKPLIPNEAIIVLGIIGLGLIFFTGGNQGLMVLGLIGCGSAFVIYIQSNQNVSEAMRKNEQNERNYVDRLDEWERKVEKIKLEEEELRRNRLSRSFQWDDLRVLHKVMTLSVARIIHEQLIDRGASVKESLQSTKNEEIIPESNKSILDKFQ